jgi:hypothetical protein
MKRPLQEPKSQRYRAIAVFASGKEGLITLGSNYAFVQENYDEAFHKLYGVDSEGNQTASIKEVHVQQWQGQSDVGRWNTLKVLPVPQPVVIGIGVRKKPVETAAEPTIG